MSPNIMKDIKDLTLKELEAEMAEMGEPGWRAAQIFGWIYERGARSFDGFSDISKPLRESLVKRYVLSPLALEEKLSSLDGTEKFLFRLDDGRFIESVLIPADGRKTVCLSTQVGCRFGCVFCASGWEGIERDLRPAEITGQVLYLRDHLDVELTNFVFMGMGEPLDNFDNVARAILIMNSPKGLGIAARRMTVSTSGIVPGIESLKSLGLQINLSLSLHAVEDDLRSKLVPVNKKYPLEKVIKACEDYVKTIGRMMTLEYILLRGVNDAASDAEGLIRIARRLHAKINLIPYSPVRGLEFASPTREDALRFEKRLQDEGVSATLRRSKGCDIRAACGQLAGKKRSS